jgi:phosphonopyruvate decarboxylase
MKEGVGFYAGVPDSLLKGFNSYVQDKHPQEHTITAANEGNAVAIVSGYYLATGKLGMVFMQNSGEGNAINPLLSLADEDVYSIPMLLLIGWRGEPGTQDEPQHIKQGKVTLSLLDTIGIPYLVLSDNFEEQVATAVATAKKNSSPFALIVQKGTFVGYTSTKPKEESAGMLREDALEKILEAISANDYVVSTTGKCSREIFEIREHRGQEHSHDFLTVGSMGHTASIAYGMALGTNRTVYCIDGDGSFLMHLGSLAVIGGRNIPPNFKYILNNNGAHESVGGQATVAKEIDIRACLKSFGFDEVAVCTAVDEIPAAMAELKRTANAALLIETKQGSRDNLGRPTISPKANKEAMMQSFIAGRD